MNSAFLSALSRLTREWSAPPVAFKEANLCSFGAFIEGHAGILEAPERVRCEWSHQVCDNQLEGALGIVVGRLQNDQLVTFPTAQTSQSVMAPPKFAPFSYTTFSRRFDFLQLKCPIRRCHIAVVAAACVANPGAPLPLMGSNETK